MPLISISILLPLAALIALVLVVRFTLPARWRIQKGRAKWWWPLVGFHSPYGYRLPNRLRVMHGSDILADSDRDVALVSRHSLLGSGIICPVCQHQAALAGEWDKVVQSAFGEGVFCICNRMLVAAPDDDVDLVDPRQPYDEKIYHFFARPLTYVKPRQKTIARPAVVGDRVLVPSWDETIDGKAWSIRNGEGDVLLIHEGIATTRVVQGLGTETVLDIPLSLLEVLEQPRIAPGDRVAINRGSRRGLIGIIQRLKDGTVSIQPIGTTSSDDTLDLPIEHLTKIQ